MTSNSSHPPIERRRGQSARLVAVASVTAVAACVTVLAACTPASLQRRSTTTTTKPRTTTTTTKSVTTVKPSVTTSTVKATVHSNTPVTTVPTTPLGAPTGAPTLKVSGAQLVDASGQTVQLRGVDRPGTEFSCVQSQKFTSDGYMAQPQGWDGSDIRYADTEAQALLTWDAPGKSGHAINTVRVPLNETCWLGNVGGLDPAHTGANYQAFIKRLVTDLTNQGMYVVLDDHWPEMPGEGPSYIPGVIDTGYGQYQAQTRDFYYAQFTVPFWEQVSAMFNQSTGFPNVMYDVFNEAWYGCDAAGGIPCSTPMTQNSGIIDNYNIYLNGGTWNVNPTDNPDIYPHFQGPIEIAGSNAVTDAIRTVSHAYNPVTISALGGGNGGIQFMGNHLPADSHNPLGRQVVAGFHAYNNLSGYSFDANSAGYTQEAITNLRDTNNNIIPGGNIAGNFPLYIGELGTISCPGTDTQITSAANYLNSKGYSWTAWGWDQGEGCGGPSLVTNDLTGATYPEGTAVKAILQALQH